MQGKAIEFMVGARKVCGQAWGDPAATPVLALHGWLDNSASFSELIPLLLNRKQGSSFYVVAIDMAGHGLSDHKTLGLAYNILEEVSDIIAVVNQLQWNTFSIIGHSRGANIAMLTAGTFPERIDALCLLDGVWPEAITQTQAPEQLARSIIDVQRKQNSRTTFYQNTEQAITVRQQVMPSLSDQVARNLCERGLVLEAKGYRWRSDPRLFAASAVKLSQCQINAFVSRITSPVTLILSTENAGVFLPKYETVLNLFADLTLEKVDNGHFLHTGNTAGLVAEYAATTLQMSGR